MACAAVVVFLLAAALAGMAFADQRKMWWTFQAWRHRDPAANEPSDSAFRAQRVVLFVAAVVFAGLGVYTLVLNAQTTRDDDKVATVDDDEMTRFGDDQVRAMVDRAAAILEEETVVDARNEDEGFGFYVSGALRQSEEYPLSFVSDAAGKTASGGERYNVSAFGGTYQFCLTVEKASDAGGSAVPGGVGREFHLTTTVENGAC